MLSRVTLCALRVGILGAWILSRTSKETNITDTTPSEYKFNRKEVLFSLTALPHLNSIKSLVALLQTLCCV